MSRSVLPSTALRLLRALGAAACVCAGAAAARAAAVVAVQPTRVADLVLLDRGFDAGLRQGMVCRVVRGTTDIAEVLVVDLRPSCSAALILNVSPRQSIRPGDLARIKIFKT